MKQVMLITSILVLSGCSHYINKIHQQLDKKLMDNNKSKKDKFALYRKNRVGKGISTKNVYNLPPRVKRQYRPGREKALQGL